MIKQLSPIICSWNNFHFFQNLGRTIWLSDNLVHKHRRIIHILYSPQ